MDNEYDFDDERPSKSQLKREAHAAQKLGEELVNLSARQLEKIDMPEELRDAIKQAQGIYSNSAKKRQLQFIGKLMRDIDTTPLAAALDQLKMPHRESVAQFHRTERWREQLIEDDQHLAAFVDTYPTVDRQQLRQLVRNARKENSAGQHGKAYRALFKLIAELQSEHEE